MESMQSQTSLAGLTLKERLKTSFDQRWTRLEPHHQEQAKKIWGVITYKWRWQLAMNIPYLAIFALDRTIPSVHRFDMAILASVTSRLPLPQFISSWLGLG